MEVAKKLNLTYTVFVPIDETAQLRRLVNNEVRRGDDRAGLLETTRDELIQRSQEYLAAKIGSDPSRKGTKWNSPLTQLEEQH